MYNHHMLVVCVVSQYCVRVIHYTDMSDETDGPNKTGDFELAIRALGAAISSASLESASIVEEDLEVDLSKDYIELLQYSPGVALYSSQEAIDRVRSRLNEREYCAIRNNCESLINWAITGKKSSNQVDTAVAVGVGVGIAAVISVAAVGLVTLFGGNSNKKTDSDSDGDK